MIKCIDVSDLKVGMYIHDLNCDWMSHPFLLKRFLVKDEAAIRKIADAGIHEVYIDTGKGMDLPMHPPFPKSNTSWNRKSSTWPAAKSRPSAGWMPRPNMAGPS
jgi:hypothetical protein